MLCSAHHCPRRVMVVVTKYLTGMFVSGLTQHSYHIKKTKKNLMDQSKDLLRATIHKIEIMSYFSFFLLLLTCTLDCVL